MPACPVQVGVGAGVVSTFVSSGDGLEQVPPSRVAEPTGAAYVVDPSGLFLPYPYENEKDEEQLLFAPGLGKQSEEGTARIKLPPRGTVIGPRTILLTVPAGHELAGTHDWPDST